MLSKKIKRGIIYMLIGATTLASVSCHKAPEMEMTGKVQLKRAENTVKIEQTEDISKLEDANTAGLSFEAARGETEGAQLILQTEEPAQFDVRLSEFANESGEKIPASATTVYVQHYVYTSKGFTSFPAGDYPDAMIPMKYYKKAKENRTEAGKNQGFWIDIQIPEDAKAGKYTGTCTVQVEKTTIEVPVSVEVYDFNMPMAPYMRSTYLIWQDWLMDGELDNTIKKYGDYYDTLLEYNLTPYYFPANTGDIDGFISCLRKYYDRVASYGIPYRETAEIFEEDNPYGGKAGERCGSIDYELFESYLVAIAKAGKEDGKNYFNKMYYYFDKVYDEVDDKKYPQMVACIETTNAVEAKVAKEQELPQDMAESLTGAKHLMSVVKGWREEFARFEELLISPLYDNLGSTKNIEMYEDLIAKGYTIESYGTVQTFPYPTRLIDEYLITGRDVFWSKFDYRLTGDLFWNVNGYCNWSAGNVVGYGRISDLYSTSCRDGVTDGDGYLFYPGRPYDLEKPFPSLRLTAVRDGIDDHSYLSILEEKSLALAEQYGISKDGIHKAIRTINEQVYAIGTSKLNFAGLQNVRRSIARLIELADSEAGLVLTAFDTTEEGITYSLAAKDGSEIRLNGEVLNATGKAKSADVYAGTNTAYAENGIFSVEACQIKTELIVGKKPELLIDAKNQAAKIKVNQTLGASVSASSETVGGRSENTVKVELAGSKLETEAQTQAYAPAVWFDIANVDQTEQLSFWLYNSGEELEINITAGTEDGMTYPVDVVVLPANSWKKIELGNLNRISRSSSTLAAVNELRLSCMNLIDASGNTYKKTLYLGSVYQKLK